MSTVKFEVIAPAPLKYGTVIAELEKVLRDEGKKAVKEFKKTIDTWTHKVGFKYDVTHANDSTMHAYPHSGAVDTWTMLELGTPSHTVPKGRTGTMSFYPRYRKKSRPRQLKSFPGGPSGTKITRRGAWTIKGIKPRQWGSRYINLRKKPFAFNVDVAVRKGAAGFFP